MDPILENALAKFNQYEINEYINKNFERFDVPSDGFCAFHCLEKAFNLENRYKIFVRHFALFVIENIEKFRNEFPNVAMDNGLIPKAKTVKDRDRNLIYNIIHAGTYPSTEVFMRWFGKITGMNIICFIKGNYENMFDISFLDARNDNLIVCVGNHMRFLSSLNFQNSLVMVLEKSHWNLLIPKPSIASQIDNPELRDKSCASTSN